MFGTKSLSSPASPVTSIIEDMIDKRSLSPPLSTSSPNSSEIRDILVTLSASQKAKELPISEEGDAEISLAIGTSSTESLNKEKSITEDEKNVGCLSSNNSKRSKSVSIRIINEDNSGSNDIGIISRENNVSAFNKYEFRKSYAVGLPSFTLREEVDISVTSADIIDCILE